MRIGPILGHARRIGIRLFADPVYTIIISEKSSFDKM
jgi:hypothetical protein